jgi:hypothetical protein
VVCPECIRESDGRWQLSWRLGWSFACVQHNRLLADACPTCGKYQRRQQFIDALLRQRRASVATESVLPSPLSCPLTT